MYTRDLHLESIKSSYFLFGPRMTGKTTLLSLLHHPTHYNLLDIAIELQLKQNPQLFWEEISALPKKSKIIVDEVQKIPALLNYIQMGIDQYHHQFIISGSSARKLKRGTANLLGGRALNFRLHSLSWHELGKDANINWVLNYGSLPKVYSLLKDKNKNEVLLYLKSYVSTYLKEEIQAEALTRNLGAFQRFLNVAAFSNGQIIEYANISRECAVPMSTVKEYFQILEDTLIGDYLWTYDRSERKKARPKFYFFDCGVIRALQNRLQDDPTPDEKGVLFETCFYQELIKIRDYYQKEDEFYLWKKYPHEIDFLVVRGGKPILAFECKSGHMNISQDCIQSFRKTFPKIPLYIVSLQDKSARNTQRDFKILPFTTALDLYQKF